MYQKIRTYKRKNGFTLIELVISVMLFSILATFVALAFLAGLRSWNSSSNRAQIRQSGSFALEIMTRDLSQANSFTIAQADQVKFDADIDNDGSDETITYDINGTELTRKVGGQETLLSPDTDTFALSYIDLNNTTMTFPVTGADRDDIRVVVISLTMDKADETINLSSSAYARNM